MPQVAAADTVTLRLADSFPTGHYIPDSLTKPFMEEVERRTNNAVKFEYYPGQQLGKAKDMLSLTQSGVADISYIAPAFVSDKMPLAAVAELPGNFTTACVGTAAYWKLAQPGGILDEKEFKPSVYVSYLPWFCLPIKFFWDTVSSTTLQA